MSLFDSIGDTVAGWYANFTEPFTNTQIPVAASSVPTTLGAAPKTATAKIQAATPAKQTSVFDSIGNLFSTVSEAATKGTQAFFNAKTQISELKAATELERIRNQAILASARNAPTAAQISLPGVSDWINNPAEARSMVTPAAIAGSVGSVSNVAVLVLGAVAVFLMLKR